MRLPIIVDDACDITALEYVLNVFRTTTAARFDFVILNNYSGALLDNIPPIFYGFIPAGLKDGGIVLPCVKADSLTDYIDISFEIPPIDLRLRGEVIPVLRDTISNCRSGVNSDLATFMKTSNGLPACFLGDGKAVLTFDIFYNIFAMMSLLNEYKIEKMRGPSYSYSKRTSLDPSMFKKPFVNYYFTLLQELIIRVYGKTDARLFDTKEGFEILLSHDVDAVEKNPVTAVKQASMLFFSGLKKAIKGDSAGIKRAGKGIKFILSSCDYNRFDNIMAIEEELEFRSFFNIYMNLPESGIIKRIKKFIFDPHYKIDSGLRTRLKEIIGRGWYIGLHSSFNAASNPERLLLEKEALTQELCLPIKTLRQHWLNILVCKTWRIEENAGIEIDTSLGFNDLPGFRAFIASPFSLYDHELGRSLNVVEIPLIIMDSSLFDYRMYTENEGYNAAMGLIKEVERFNGCVSIVWHQHVFSEDYGWGNLYKRLLGYIKEMGGRCWLPEGIRE